VLFDRDQIADRVRTVAEEMTEAYFGRVPVLVAVLHGATVFASDLSRQLGVEHELDFVGVTAYGDAHPGSEVQVVKDLACSIEGRDVVLVEDLVDTGLTLNFMLDWLRARRPASIAVCALLDRPHRRLIDTPVEWTCFAAPDRFVVGYGFDYRQRFRNLADIHELDVAAVAATSR
jgi:hypoxanthine phosphoribosyltransferase